jgi:hypothetical protein
VIINNNNGQEQKRSMVVTPTCHEEEGSHHRRNIYAVTALRKIHYCDAGHLNGDGWSWKLQKAVDDK